MKNAFICSAFGVPVSGGTTGNPVIIGTPTPAQVDSTSDASYTTFVTVPNLSANTAYEIVVDGTWFTSASGTGPDFAINGSVAPAAFAATLVAIRTGSACMSGTTAAYGSIASGTSGTTTPQRFICIVNITTGASSTDVTFQIKLFSGDSGTVSISSGAKSHWFAVV